MYARLLPPSLRLRTPLRDDSLVINKGLPHTRGDGPGSYGAKTKKPYVCPTHVGMARLLPGTLRLPLRLPHTRGDGPATGVFEP